MRYGPERILNLTGGSYSRDLREQLALFSRFVLFHLAIKGVMAALSIGRPVDWGVSIAFGTCLLLSFRQRTLQWALWLALPAMCVRMGSFFPSTANLSGLEFLSLLFLGIAQLDNPNDRPVLIDSLRFLAFWAMLFSGIQKMLYGTYFAGAYLSMLIANQGRFTLPFYFLMSSESIDALHNAPVHGPYLAHSAAILVLSNIVYVLEILAAILLVVRKTRKLGVVLACALLVAIEVAAREYMFGVFLLNLLFLFLDEKWSRRGLILAVAFYSVMLLDTITLDVFGGFH